MDRQTKLQKGNAFIGAVILTSVVSVVALAAQSYYSNFIHQTRTTQIRSAITALEAIVRNLALQPYVYICGADNGQLQLSDFTSCRLDTSQFDRLRYTPVIGAKCSGGAQCGILLDIDDTTVTSGRFKATLTYNGDDLALNKTDIELEIPIELMQSSHFSCADQNPDTPAFVGFASNGMPQCRGFSNSPCPNGTYVESVDFPGLRLNCRSLAATNKHVVCGAEHMIGSVSWNNDVISATCTPIPPAPLVGGGVNATDPAPLPPPAPTPTPTPSSPPDTGWLVRTGAGCSTGINCPASEIACGHPGTPCVGVGKTCVFGAQGTSGIPGQPSIILRCDPESSMGGQGSWQFYNLTHASDVPSCDLAAPCSPIGIGCRIGGTHYLCQ